MRTIQSKVVDTTRRCTGFSLVEIVVVIAIVGVLTAILIPTLLAAKGQAKATTCVSNLHQLGLSVQMYEQDNGDLMPPLVPRADIFFGPNNKTYTFHDPLQAYGMTTALYHCPDALAGDRDVPDRSDYVMRFVFYMTRLDGTGTDLWQLVPDNATVIAYCRYHHGHVVSPTGQYLGQGIFNVLKNDGAVMHVPLGEVKHVRWTGKLAATYDTTLDVPDVFPGETWPPEMNKLDVHRF
jgi:prepilin-type N-terminal cleavage/methylation domain